MLVSLQEIGPGGNAEDEVSNKASVTRATRTFRGVCDSPFDDGGTVLQGCDLPGAQHPTWNFLYLRRRHADRDSRSKLVWIATLSYGNELQLQINPLAEPALVGWATETAQVPAIRDSGPDKTGTNPRAILNSAGQVFDNYPGRDDSIWIATIRKNLASLSPEIFVYIDGVNLDTVVIDGRSFQPGQCKVMAIDVPLEWSYRNGVQYKQVAFKIGCRHDWQTHMLDQGLVAQQMVGGGYQTVRLVHQDGTLCPRPVLLDGSGHSLQQVLGHPPTPADAHYINSDVYSWVPFHGMIPLS